MQNLKQKITSLSEEELFTLGVVFGGSALVESLLPSPLNILVFPLLATGVFFQSGTHIEWLENGYRMSKNAIAQKYAELKHAHEQKSKEIDGGDGGEEVAATREKSDHEEKDDEEKEDSEEF